MYLHFIVGFYLWLRYFPYTICIWKRKLRYVTKTTYSSDVSTLKVCGDLLNLTEVFFFFSWTFIIKLYFRISALSCFVGFLNYTFAHIQPISDFHFVFIHVLLLFSFLKTLQLGIRPINKPFMSLNITHVIIYNYSVL